MKRLNLKKLILKRLYFWLFITSMIIWIIDLYFNIFKKFYTDPANLSAIASIDGTLIGFLVTAFTLFMAIVEKNTGFIKRVKKYTYDKIYAITIIYGTIAFFFSIIFWILQGETYLFNRLCIYMFITGIMETCLSMYYLFVFIFFMDNN